VAAGMAMAHVTGMTKDMEGRVYVSCVHDKGLSMGRNCRLGLGRRGLGVGKRGICHIG
jgi:hypothetical protein